MLDYNHRPGIAERINAAVDAALEAERAATPLRDYLGGSRLGHPCERALQFEFAGAPKDEGQDFPGRVLRIFAIGHELEELAIRWLRAAGLDLYTRKGNRTDGAQFGFSVAGGRIRGHVDGIVADAPAALGLRTPALWECKTMNAKNWRTCVKDGVTVSKPVYAAQIALYQAYMEATVPGISAAPALFTAINKDTAELHHELVPFDADLAQRMSDRGVRILRATDAGDLLPRIAANRDFFECRFCPWAERCWSLPA
ncbi:PD-(D/E)XK nuclease family protein [Roseovarius sp. E0-M6]|uniref:PD-(D/E)XK nuclease family protein n=1 Tax=Roseovarius sp. E0-M6 TaxID=3127118 RepID=UPI003010073F